VQGGVVQGAAGSGLRRSSQHHRSQSAPQAAPQSLEIALNRRNSPEIGRKSLEISRNWSEGETNLGGDRDTKRCGYYFVTFGAFVSFFVISVLLTFATFFHYWPLFVAICHSLSYVYLKLLVFLGHFWSLLSFF
jgi:hypothetical protein